MANAGPLTLAAALTVLLSAPATAQSAGTPAGAAALNIAPHRAAYDITLAASKAGSGVGEVMGRMVYEITGNACEGFTQNMRIVTRMAASEGNEMLSDMRSTTWEDGAGDRFRFELSQLRDEKGSDATTGDARRVAPGIAVELTRPERKELKLGADVMFPMQHTIGLLAAARGGKSIFVANLFDGSEKGEKVYATTAVIGPRRTGANAKLAKAKNAERLDQLVAWPVSISYFEKGKEAADAVPDYELAFLAFENGVSRKLYIDYGEFAIKGTMTEITFLDPGKCAPPR